ncbi:hypothetical protein [Sphingopyxis terrae]|uniref:hypothetical protein n=1 Tax=Sphingopyxis terrae TaxID=33052 RepID=UPI000788F655|nr:hypothetical protein [Sphingopyxis terrae]
MRTLKHTEGWLAQAASTFVVLLVAQWFFDVRDPDTSKAIVWLIGIGKVVVMIELVLFGSRWLQLKYRERNSNMGSNNG